MDIIAVGKFGSSARGDADKHSDIDLLVIGRHCTLATSIKSRLESIGYEVSYYSDQRFLKMAARGDLFVHHVLHEGIALFDQCGFFEQARSAFRMRSSYRREQMDGVRLLEIASHFPDTPAGRAWSTDVLACSVRVFAVPTLAEHGRPCYSHSRMSVLLPHVRGLDREAGMFMHELRCLKKRYRSGSFTVTRKKLDYLHKSSCRLLGVDLNLSTFSVNQCATDVLQQDNDSAYLRSRRAERLLACDDLPIDVALSSVKCRLRSPSSYAFSFRDGGDSDNLVKSLIHRL